VIAGNEPRRSQEIVKMVNFAQAFRALDIFLRVVRPDSPNFVTPVQFDPQLTTRLLDMHEALNARFAKVLCMLERDPAAAVPAIHECIQKLQDLRRREAVWLYPFIAARVDDDIAARRQLMQLRIGMLAESRATLRQLDELSEALTTGAPFRAVADLASASMADYLRRDETEIYPLYNLIGTRPALSRRA
jgi:hypothetical protein